MVSLVAKNSGHWYYMAMDEIGLGRRLQAARVKAGLTQQQLCQQAGLSYSTLTKIERGAIKSPSIFTIQSIAAVLQVGLEELLGLPAAASPSKSPTPPNTKDLKRSKSGVSFVYFDINDCVVRFTYKAFGRLAEASGQTPDTVETLFWQHNDQVCRGDMTIEEFNAVLARELKLPKVDWLDYYLDTVEPIPKMTELVQWAAKHYRIGLLSNIMPGGVNGLLSRHLLPEADYTVILDSVMAGAIKPETEMFELATQKAGCPASEILFIDDSRTNLTAAAKCGWHVLRFDDYQVAASVQSIRQALVF